MTVPLIGTIASWRVTFLIVGLPGLLFALLIGTIKEPLRRNLLLGTDGQPVRASFAEAFSQMRVRWQSVLGVGLGTVFQSMCNYALSAWAPTFFLRVHGWTPGQAGKALALIMLTFGCFGIYAGGSVSDRWFKRGLIEGPLKVGVISAAGTLILLPLAFLVPQAGWTLAMMAPAVFFLALPMGTCVAALQRIFPNQVRGQVSAVLLFILNLGGLSLGPLLPGLLNDRLFHDGKMVGVSLALTIAGGAILMLAANRSVYRPYRIHYQMMQAATHRD
jgi:predicted MFS family arabinose efflux permease